MGKIKKRAYSSTIGKFLDLFYGFFLNLGISIIWASFPLFIFVVIDSMIGIFSFGIMIVLLFLFETKVLGYTKERRNFFYQGFFGGVIFSILTVIAVFFFIFFSLLSHFL